MTTLSSQELELIRFSLPHPTTHTPQYTQSIPAPILLTYSAYAQRHLATAIISSRRKPRKSKVPKTLATIPLLPHSATLLALKHVLVFIKTVHGLPLLPSATPFIRLTGLWTFAEAAGLYRTCLTLELPWPQVRLLDELRAVIGERPLTVEERCIV
ncbi:hypothetical protein EJ06DRAFT_519776 [Trichodelitschia bisporula]|uniref:Uncharacterized protein n=1 Tax=Trichodelitschia bisporula TaxID=703511 RepID=A0A6G1I387_9PEZI|nr:hypothetical protein EJ06DRAFT_519776 [Trichodelitschia bisporula]